MNVICGVNGETWQQVELFLCHHCGMPVCAKDGVTIAADDAFAAGQEPVSRAAMHCPSCADEYHRGAARYHGWSDPKAAPRALRAGQPVTGSYPAPDPQGQDGRARAAGRA
ncbi:MAG: hypothetical protein ABSA93_40335 [Streptosporangiaceae bacterium]|jgi:hypothetical protein